MSELPVFIRSRLVQSHHDLIELDGSYAAIVTLEGIGVLVRLVREAERVGTALQVVSPTRLSSGSSARPARSNR